jgi:hypothetical protein
MIMVQIIIFSNHASVNNGRLFFNRPNYIDNIPSAHISFYNMVNIQDDTR